MSEQDCRKTGECVLDDLEKQGRGGRLGGISNAETLENSAISEEGGDGGGECL